MVSVLRNIRHFWVLLTNSRQYLSSCATLNTHFINSVDLHFQSNKGWSISAYGFYNPFNESIWVGSPEKGVRKNWKRTGLWMGLRKDWRMGGWGPWNAFLERIVPVRKNGPPLMESKPCQNSRTFLGKFSLKSMRTLHSIYFAYSLQLNTFFMWHRMNDFSWQRLENLIKFAINMK